MERLLNRVPIGLRLCGTASARGSVRWWGGAYDALLFWEGFSEPPKAPIRRRQTLFPVLLLKPPCGTHATTDPPNG